MKKITILLACIFLLLGCTKSAAITDVDTSNGPVIKKDEKSDGEKILSMIQSCISDYNEKDINELRSYYKSDIPSLPLEISSLPNINSLSDLSEIKEDEDSNTFYEGMYTIDKYNVIFKIYYPSGADFWPNGDVSFQVDLNQITIDDPQFTEYKSSLSYLLSEEKNVIDMLYGSNAILDENSVIEDRYYEVIQIDDRQYSTIQELKDYAESVFTKEYLEENYYPNSFDSDYPVYKEYNGKLYCLSSEITSLVTYDYDTDYIVASKQENNIIKINLLTKVMDTILPEIKEITLQYTDEGYRLASAV